MFDPLLKTLCDAYPRPWIDLICRSAGLPSGAPADVIKPNIPSKSFDVDRAYRLLLPEKVVLHAEFESSWQPDRPGRFFVYNTLLERDQQCPVLTVVFLLRPQASSNDLTCERNTKLPSGEIISTWNHRVIRLWELAPEIAMQSPWTMPLAPLMRVAASEIAPLAGRMISEFQKLPENEASELAVASSVLAGLRFRQYVREESFFGGCPNERINGLPIDLQGRARGRNKLRKTKCCSSDFIATRLQKTWFVGRMRETNNCRCDGCLCRRRLDRSN